MKKITFLFALLCASVMGWATDYCHTEMSAGGKTIYLTCQEISTGNYQLKVECNEAMSGLGGSFCEVNGVGGYQLNAAGHFNLSADGKTITCDIASSVAPNVYTPLYVLIDGEKNFGYINDASWAACAGGDPTPDPDPDPTPVPDPDDHTAGGHTIHVDASYVGDIYTLVITSADDMEGLGGSFWNVNGVGTDMRSNDATKSYTVSGDKKTITCQVQSSSAPNIYTPLYVLMPGEVNFGSVTLNWEDRTPITSEYCNYQGPETQQDGHYYAITWETDPSGNVVITIGNGTGAGACSFRNGGFEGGNNGLANFVVSDDDFATTTPATDYFTVTSPTDGDLEYVMTKIADLPAGAKIKHLSAGAIAWREAGTDRWCWPEFTYTYGGTCNQLDAPTNVAIDGTNHITFDAVAGADSYTALVSLGGVQKYSQVVASGDELTFVPLVTGDYIVNVIASGAGKVDSDPSADLVWHLEAAPVVLGNSEYCEHVMLAGDNREAAFTWETDGSGNIIITISATRGDAADTHFRGNGMALGNFKVGSAKEAASNYFNHACGGSNQVTLSLKNPAVAPALGEKIYFNQTVEYATSLDGNAWPTLDFEWTYGTECSGFAVSATPNNNEMGTAVVQKAGVDVTNVEDGDEVSFIATVADAELYRFVNWTKAGVEVSTSATYVTTITETTNLVANFDYIRNVYCHAEINSVQNKKLYLTLGAIGGGQYQIKIEGSAEAQLTGLINANYTINWVTTDIVDGDKTMSGQDVPFNNDRWAFDASGYGSATATFGIAEGHTWEDIYVWNHAIYFSTAAGEVGYTGFPGRYNIDWTATCADAEAPVFVKAEGEVLNESSVRLTIQATDNWEGLLTYTIARAGAEPIISNHASGEEFTEDVTGLTAGTEYDFTVTVSDGVNNASTHILVTPIADETKPVMGAASLVSNTYDQAVLSVAATDNVEVARFHVVDATNGIDANYVASADQITITGLIHGTTYNFTITAIDLAGLESDNNAVIPVAIPFNTGANLALNQPSEGGYYDNNPTESADKANDGNDGSAWVTYGAHAAELDWWVVDLGRVYTLTNITALWANDAYATAYMLQARVEEPTAADKADDAAWVTLANVSGVTAGEERSTNVSGVGRYVRFRATANAGGFFRLRELRVFGSGVAPVDTEAPVMTSASLVSNTDSHAIIAVAATDNQGIANYHVVDAGNSFDGHFVAEAGNITVTGLTGGTNYTLVITAVDFFGNESENSKSVSVNTTAHYTQPLAACPAPTWDAALVKAMYSPTYNADYNHQDWNSGTVATKDEFGRKYVTNGNGYFGADGFALNCLLMEKLHYDIWIENDATIRFVPIWGGAEQGITKSLVGQQWNSIDIDLTEYTGITNWGNIYQMKIDQASNLTFWIANAYFYREAPYVDTEAPTNVSASKVAEGFYSVKISAQAEDNSGAVNFKVMNGEEVLATGAAATGVATTINVNGLTMGTAYNFNVIAYDEAGNEAEPVAVSATTKVLPASAPIDLTGKQVVPVYTDATTCDVTGIQTGGWGEATNAQWIEIAPGDNVFYVQNFNYAGWHSWGGGNVDARGMNYLHVDIYSMGATQMSVTPISAGHEGVANITLTPNAWTSADVPLSAYAENNIDWENIFQFKFMNPAGGDELIIDNVYFWKGLVRDDYWMAPGELGTICIPNGAVAEGGDIYQLVGKNSEGKIVFSTVDNNQMEPGKPYLFEATSNAMKFYYTDATPAADPDNSGAMKGTFVDLRLPDDDPDMADLSDIYYFAGRALWSCVDLSESGLHVSANRAWVKMDEVEDITTPSSAPGRRYIIMGVNGENQTQGFENLESGDAPRKVMIEGTLYILLGEKVYDATGRLVK